MFLKHSCYHYINNLFDLLTISIRLRLADSQIFTDPFSLNGLPANRRFFKVRTVRYLKISFKYFVGGSGIEPDSSIFQIDVYPFIACK